MGKNHNEHPTAFLLIVSVCDSLVWCAEGVGMIYQKISRTDIWGDRNHFYKMYRYVFFGKFIFCIDIYPSETRISFFIPGKIDWTLLRLT